MIKQICILTKSYKHGGYCVAGIDVNNNEWIRLVNSDNPANDEIRKEQMFLNGIRIWYNKDKFLQTIENREIVQE